MTIHTKAVTREGATYEMDWEDSWSGFSHSLTQILMNSKSVTVEKEDGQVTTYTYKED